MVTVAAVRVVEVPPYVHGVLSHLSKRVGEGVMVGKGLISEAATRFKVSRAASKWGGERRIVGRLGMLFLLLRARGGGSENVSGVDEYSVVVIDDIHRR